MQSVITNCKVVEVQERMSKSNKPYKMIKLANPSTYNTIEVFVDTHCIVDKTLEGKDIDAVLRHKQSGFNVRTVFEMYNELN